MTKTLTEQWRDGTLAGGDYYIKTTGFGIDKIIINYYEEELKQFDGLCDCAVAEVIAPVPNYDEYQTLLSDQLAKNEADEINAELLYKIAKLKNKLAIATKTLEEFKKTEDNYLDFGLTSSWKEVKLNPNRVATKALKKMEGVK